METKFRASDIIRQLDIPIVLGPDSDVVTGNSEHFMGYVESASLRMLHVHAQQALFALFRGHHGLSIAAAMTALDNAEVSTRKDDLREYIDTIVTVHALTRPHLPRPRRRGIAALGMLRISTDPDTRDRAAQVLIDEDPTSLSIYEAHEHIYSGHEPTSEIPEILRLLALKDSESVADEDRKLAARLRDMDFHPFHLSVWEDRALRNPG